MREQLDNYREKILRSIEFIEDNIGNGIDLKMIAAESNLSEFHFHRLFHLLVGETPGNYLRRRRLHEASICLTRGEKVIDVALKFGYSSSDSFTKAYTKHYGFPPKNIKGNKDGILPFGKPPLLMKNLVHMDQVVSMEPKIVTMESFKLVGINYYGNPEDGEIPEFWKRYYYYVENIPNRVGKDWYGLCYNYQDFVKKARINYMVGVKVKDFTNIPVQASAKTIPEHEYAVFTHMGPTDNLKDTYDYINGTYFPNKKYNATEDFDFELYTCDDNGNELVKICIPITRK